MRSGEAGGPGPAGSPGRDTRHELQPHLDLARAHARREPWDEVERTLRRAAEHGAGAPLGVFPGRIPLAERAPLVIQPFLAWLEVERPEALDSVRSLLASRNGG
jgi:hypothetical protein